METVVRTEDGVLLTEQIQQLIMSIDLDPWCPTTMGLIGEQKPKLECCCIVDGSERVGCNNVFVLRACVCVLCRVGLTQLRGTGVRCWAAGT